MSLNHSAEDSRFIAVNPEWRYAIQFDLQTLIQFDPQPDDLWLAHAPPSGQDIRLLAGPVVISLLNEALAAGKIIVARQVAGKHALVFQAAPLGAIIV